VHQLNKISHNLVNRVRWGGVIRIIIELTVFVDYMNFYIGILKEIINILIGYSKESEYQEIYKNQLPLY
jgi:hypothetical protein